MAKEKEKTEAVVETAAQESVFDAAEIAANARELFGYSIDLANAAFDVNHVERCTLNEAKRIIKEFAERKVK